jgi:cytochrome c-type biogenesis protein
MKAEFQNHIRSDEDWEITMQEVESKREQKSLRLLTAAGILLGGLLVLFLAFLSGSGETQASAPGGSLWLLAPAAFLAGILSFLSPCTLPILPAYFAFTFQSKKQNVVWMTVAFFLGLATTLTILGASATALSQLLFQHMRQITLLGGLAIIALGIFSLLGKGFAGPQIQERPSSTAIGSYFYGATFALGWTACIGPILGAILTLLATQGLGIFQGALLAFIYALGLGAPLILVSTFFSRLGQGSRFWKVMRGKGFEIRVGSHLLHLHTTSLVSGILLIGIGYLLASGQLTAITQLAQSSELSLWVIEMEERLRGLFGLK